MDTQNGPLILIPKEGKHGTRIGSTTDQPSEGGAVLDSDIVDINENYIHYINSNPKLVKETKVDELVVAYTGNKVHYLTLDSPCDNKKIAVIPLPIRMPNREIITSTQTAILSKKDLPIEAQKSHLFLSINKALLTIGTFCDHGCQAVLDD